MRTQVERVVDMEAIDKADVAFGKRRIPRPSNTDKRITATIGVHKIVTRPKRLLGLRRVLSNLELDLRVSRRYVQVDTN
jgi:hypothetical protein